MIPAKPMAPKTPTPPVQKIETWATFEPIGPLAKSPPRCLASNEHRTSEVAIQHVNLKLAIIARRPARAHVLVEDHLYPCRSGVIWPPAQPT